MTFYESLPSAFPCTVLVSVVQFLFGLCLHLILWFVIYKVLTGQALDRQDLSSLHGLVQSSLVYMVGVQTAFVHRTRYGKAWVLKSPLTCTL